MAGTVDGFSRTRGGWRRSALEVLAEERAATGEAWVPSGVSLRVVQAEELVFREEDVDACLFTAAGEVRRELLTAEPRF